jgi:soluble cytochrome b562
MRKIISVFIPVVLLGLVQTVFAQEEIIETRQEMADHLSAVKKAANAPDWAAAIESFNKAKEAWQNQVKPILTDDHEKASPRFTEYFDRIGEVEKELDELGQILASQKQGEVETKVNQIIWSISHHPKGFEVGPFKYSVWDWVFGLGIGGGFCIFAIVFGLYLRRSYYRRYKKGLD